MQTVNRGNNTTTTNQRTTVTGTLSYDARDAAAIFPSTPTSRRATTDDNSSAIAKAGLCRPNFNLLEIGSLIFPVENYCLLKIKQHSQIVPCPKKLTVRLLGKV